MRYRTVPASLWLDPKFRRLAPAQKLLLLHLITGPHANVAGIYCCPLIYCAHETGLSLDEVRQAMAALEDAECAQWDEPTETIWVVGMLDYQGRGEKIYKAVADQIESLPPSPAVTAFRARHVHLPIPYRYPFDGSSPKEKEQEEEKEETRVADDAPTSAALEVEEEVPYAEIIAYLNEKTGKRFRSAADGARKHIHARWQDGYRPADFRKVIDVKVADWRGTDFAKYLRPATLFGPKFEDYLNSQTSPAEPAGEAYRSFKEEERDYETR